MDVKNEPDLTNIIQLILDESPHEVIYGLLDMKEVHIHTAGLSDSVSTVLCLEGKEAISLEHSTVCFAIT